MTLLGPEVAPHLPEQQPTDHGLPPGVHPNDPSGPDFVPGPPDQPQEWTPGRPPYDVENYDAIATYERASHEWDAGAVYVDSQNGGTAIVVGRQKGRKSVTIWVPNTDAGGNTPNGVLLANREGALQGITGGNLTGDMIVLNKGDSITIDTEASVWAGLIGSNSTGFCQFIATYNPPGGSLGAT